MSYSGSKWVERCKLENCGSTLLSAPPPSQAWVVAEREGRGFSAHPCVVTSRFCERFRVAGPPLRSLLRRERWSEKVGTFTDLSAAPLCPLRGGKRLFPRYWVNRPALPATLQSRRYVDWVFWEGIFGLARYQFRCLNGPSALPGWEGKEAAKRLVVHRVLLNSPGNTGLGRKVLSLAPYF